MGGTVLDDANAVFLSADGPFLDSLRHELVHLFSAQWNQYPPPMLQEGLAVWMQGRDEGALIADVARQWLYQPDSYLAPLLDGRYFCCGKHQSLLCPGGGFTGFLIQKFGWHRYRDCYRTANHQNQSLSSNNLA